MTAGAGVTMEKLTTFAAKKSLAGLDWAGGLPGTLGGAIRGNAGCFGGEMKDVVKTVRSFNMKTMRPVTRTATQCRFGYRTSIFKQRPGEIIISSDAPYEKEATAKKSPRDFVRRRRGAWRAMRLSIRAPVAFSKMSPLQISAGLGAKRIVMPCENSPFNTAALCSP